LAGHSEGRSQDKDSIKSKSEGIRCIGNVCFNPETGKIEVELNRGSCPPDVVKAVVENIIRGAEVEFVLPKKPEAEEKI